MILLPELLRSSSDCISQAETLASSLRIPFMSSFSSPAPHFLDDLGLDPRLFCVSKEVAHAIQSGFPVVALESTIITHGLPVPTNYETAMAAERCIRDRGALPATVAIVQGVVHVGASEEVGPLLPLLALLLHMFTLLHR